MLNTHRLVPAVVSGYELSPDRSWFSVIIPEATINLVSNPSVELATTGYSAVSSATLERTTDYQRHGAWALKVTPAAVATSGVYYGTVSLIAGSTYTFSLDFKGQGGQEYKISFADTSGNLLGAGKTFRATGRWQRVKVTWLETNTQSRRLYITKASGATLQPFYLDGLQVEAKGYDTTYCDGDQQGFTPAQVAFAWTGATHASPSYRTADTRAGGRIVSLDDYGFGVMSVTGLGAASPDNVSSPYGLLDGAYYQRTVMPPRQFALVGYVAGAGVAAVQRAREGLIAAFRHDTVAPDQPLVLVYQRTDCKDDRGDVLYIPCIYSGGLEGNLDNLYQERLAVAFTQLDPYVTLAGDTGEALDPSDTFGSSVGLYQDLNGVWRALSAGGPHLRRVLVSEQGIFLGFMNVAATTFTIYRFDPASGTLTSLGTSSAGATLHTMFLSSRGHLWAGGTFTALGGVVVSNAAYYDFTTGLWTAVGTPGFMVRAFAESLGSINYGMIAGGENVAGTDGHVKTWNGITTWTALAGGTINDSVYALAITPPVPVAFSSPTEQLFIGGNFSNCYGTVCTDLAVCTLSAGVPGAIVANGAFNAQISELATLPNGHIVAGGAFTTVGGITNFYIAEYTGQAWQTMDNGLGGPCVADCQSLAVSPDGLLYAVSPGLDRSALQALAPCGGIVWNGRSWTPINLQSGASNPQCVGAYGQGRLIFGSTSTTNLSAGTAEVVNNGSAKVYPVIRIRLTNFTSTVYALPYYLENLTTGARISFNNLFLRPDELLTLDTDPTQPSLVSSFTGSRLSALLPGSDLAGFALAPGLNRIALLVSVYAGTGTVEAAIFWRERSYGLDVAAR